MIKIHNHILYLLKKIKSKKENEIIKKILDEKDEINLVDIGGYGGVQDRWLKIKEFINLQIFEPNKDTSKEIKNVTKKFDLHENIIGDKDGSLKINICKDPGVSSVLKPNIKLLNKYPNAKRFKIIKKQNAKVKKLDSCNIKNIDFIKIDVQGYTLQVLKGASKSLKKAIALEVECEFIEVYKNQALADEIISFLKKYNFEFLGFTDIIKWEKISDKKIISKRQNALMGDTIFVNALFVKKKIKNNFLYIKKIICIYILYGYYSNALILIKKYHKKLKVSNNFILALEKSNNSEIIILKTLNILLKIFGSEDKLTLLK